MKRLRQRKPLATSAGPWRNETFMAAADVIEVAEALDTLPQGPLCLRHELALFWRVLRAAFDYETLLLFSSRGHLKPELVATILLGFLPQRWRPAIVFYGEMFEPDPGFKGWLERCAMRLADRAITLYSTHTKAEIPVLAKNWGISPGKIRASGFYLQDMGQLVVPKPRGNHVFAGGNSFRDYEPLIEAARLIPNREIIICSNRLEGRTDLPANVRAGLVAPEDYDDLIETAAAVVVPLKTEVRRITGMLTYLRAMRAGKPVIVSNALGVSEFIDHKDTGLVVENTPKSYAEAIEWVLSQANTQAVDAMCDRAQIAVTQTHTVAAHVEHLLEIVQEAALRSATQSIECPDSLHSSQS